MHGLADQVGRLLAVPRARLAQKGARRGVLRPEFLIFGYFQIRADGSVGVVRYPMLN